MVERIRLEPKKSGNSSEVGYCKPPKSSQFKPGQSGYPAGRRKGSRNLKTEVRATLRSPVNLNKNGRRSKVSTLRATLMVLREKALAGDQRAIQHLTGLALRFDEEIGDSATHGVDGNDQAILDAYFNERNDEANKARRPDQANRAPANPIQQMRTYLNERHHRS